MCGQVQGHSVQIIRFCDSALYGIKNKQLNFIHMAIWPHLTIWIQARCHRTHYRSHRIASLGQASRSDEQWVGRLAPGALQPGNDRVRDEAIAGKEKGSQVKALDVKFSTNPPGLPT